MWAAIQSTLGAALVVGGLAFRYRRRRAIRITPPARATPPEPPEPEFAAGALCFLHRHYEYL